MMGRLRKEGQGRCSQVMSRNLLMITEVWRLMQVWKAVPDRGGQRGRTERVIVQEKQKTEDAPDPVWGCRRGHVARWTWRGVASRSIRRGC